MNPIAQFVRTPIVSKKDEPLEKLLAVVNEGRGTKKYPLIDYPRLNKMLMKLGKSKRNWDRDIFIASVLDRGVGATKYFWYILHKK